MYRRKACQLVKELESGEKDQLTAFYSDLFEQVVAKCSQHHLELQSLIRYNRVEIIHSLVWKIGHVLSQEIEEKLCHSEVEYFKKHFAALKSYMSTVQLDLTVDMVLPKDPYIQVRVLDDIDQGIVLSDDKTANFSRHSMHFLKRTDAEQFISRVSYLGLQIL